MDTPVHHILDKTFNQGNFAVVEELLAPDNITPILSWGIPGNRWGSNSWLQASATLSLIFIVPLRMKLEALIGTLPTGPCAAPTKVRSWRTHLLA